MIDHLEIAQCIGRKTGEKTVYTSRRDFSLLTCDSLGQSARGFVVWLAANKRMLDLPGNHLETVSRIRLKKTSWPEIPMPVGAAKPTVSKFWRVFGHCCFWRQRHS